MDTERPQKKHTSAEVATKNIRETIRAGMRTGETPQRVQRFLATQQDYQPGFVRIEMKK